MKTIKVNQVWYEPQALYQKANTKSQRALLGYMAKGGFLRDPIYGGAFKLVREIESCAGLYILTTKEAPKITTQIIHISECAMFGMWDEFSFSEREIKTISMQFGNLYSLKGK